MEEFGAGDEGDVAELLPTGEGEGDLGGIGLTALVLEPIGEGFGYFVGDGFEFLFLAFFVGGVAGGGGLLGGNEVGEGGDHGD